MQRPRSEPVRIGFYICHCGTNIAGMVDVGEVSKYAATLPDVVVSRDYKYMCSDPGQELVKRDILEFKLNRIVVARRKTGVIMRKIDITQLIEAGAHFGHLTRRWNPKMKPYIPSWRRMEFI